ncbi:PQQ-binding-like beta-propeller repeat protein [Myroides sp. NP-2]|uniref:outer membrane protein assembly factor BamB family protein n=1 Tax=Myroides sp. NP-2 TaxID=2759945 RepID=UPI0015FB74A9|nr:PQQ-binding-like beta-propeller repeat protein [Myroides sp. NP-2]MBB1149537.1 PQQ-binding-like beta-propeller repeat protein [Myroides sp. NP-2]
MKKNLLLILGWLVSTAVLGQSTSEDLKAVPPTMGPESKTNQYSNNKIGTEYDFVLNEQHAPIQTVPLDHDAILIYDYDGTLKSFNLKTQKINWNFQAKDSIVTYSRNKLTLENGVVYIPFLNGELYALNHKTGEVFWEVKIGIKNIENHKMMINQIPVIHNDLLYLVTQYENSNIYAFDKNTGHHIWNYKLEFPYNHMPVMYTNNKVIVPNAGYVYNFDAETGKALYARGFKRGMYSKPVSDGTSVFIADLGSEIFALHPDNLDIIWQIDLVEGSIGHKMAYVNNQLLVGTSRSFYSINPKDGAILWQTEVTFKEQADRRFELKQMEVFNNKIYAYNNKSTFFIVNPKDGKIEKEIDLQNTPISNIEMQDETYAFFYCEVGLIRLNVKTNKEELLYVRASIQDNPKENYIKLVR